MPLTILMLAPCASSSSRIRASGHCGEYGGVSVAPWSTRERTRPGSLKSASTWRAPRRYAASAIARTSWRARPRRRPGRPVPAGRWRRARPRARRGGATGPRRQLADARAACCGAMPCQDAPERSEVRFPERAQRCGRRAEDLLGFAGPRSCPCAWPRRAWPGGPSGGVGGEPGPGPRGRRRARWRSGGRSQAQRPARPSTSAWRPRAAPPGCGRSSARQPRRPRAGAGCRAPGRTSAPTPRGRGPLVVVPGRAHACSLRGELDGGPPRRRGSPAAGRHQPEHEHERAEPGERPPGRVGGDAPSPARRRRRRSRRRWPRRWPGRTAVRWWRWRQRRRPAHAASPRRPRW